MGTLTGVEPAVEIADDPQWLIKACYCRKPARLIFNPGQLGRAWFARGVSDDVNALLIHEFGHHYSLDHLSSEYHDALCRLGAKLARLMIERPNFLRPFGADDETRTESEEVEAGTSRGSNSAPLGFKG